MNSGGSGLLILHGDDSKREPEADLVIDTDFDVVETVFGKLNAPKNMHIGRVGIQSRESKLDGGLGDGCIVIAAHHKGFLFKLTGPSAPSGPETEFKKPDGNHRGGDHIDDTNECLTAIDFLTHIFTENRGLEIGKDVCCDHND